MSTAFTHSRTALEPEPEPIALLLSDRTLTLSRRLHLSLHPAALAFPSRGAAAFPKPAFFVFPAFPRRL
jgi:hypothetical protein